MSIRSFKVQMACKTMGAAALVVLVTACSHDDQETHPSKHDAVVVVAAAHANAMVPKLTGQAAEAVEDVLRHGGQAAVVKVSGQPALSADLKLREIEGTPRGREVLLRNNLNRIDEEISIPASTDGSDGLEAVAIAADWLRGTNASKPLIVFIGPGLNDRGRFDFTAPGMITARPAETVEYLQTTSSLPDLDSFTAHLVGTGYTTSPQQPLDAVQRANVRELWRSALEAAGATVEINPEPPAAQPVETTATVGVVEVPEVATPPQCSREEVVFTDQSAVSFHPESTEFVDNEAATATLGALARWLSSDPRRTAAIRGTTADDRGSRDRLRELGARRAETVADELARSGALRGQLTTNGVGADFPEYIRPDIDESTGLLLPGPASLNRSVRIALNDPC